MSAFSTNDLEREIREACSEVTGLKPDQVEVMQLDKNFWEVRLPEPPAVGSEDVPVTFRHYPGQSSPDILEPHTYWVVSVKGGGMECSEVIDAPGIAAALAEAFEDYGMEWEMELPASAAARFTAPGPGF